jgi:membrane protein DedA with SNARE-associated domain
VAQRLIELVAGVQGPVLLLIVALLAYGETAMFAGLIVPGEIGMVVAGASAKAAGMPLPLVIAAGIVGAILGDTTSYWIGRTAGKHLICRWEPVRKRVEPRLERAEAHFERRGGAAVFLGRFVGALRAVVPATAGMSRMPFHRFLAWNAAASIVWAGAIIGIGYTVGRQAASVVDRYGLAVSAAIVVIAGTAFVLRRRHASVRSA